MALELGSLYSKLVSQDPARDALIAALVHAVLHLADKVEHLANVTEGV